MQSELLNALRARQPDIRERWLELLRIEPFTTPLAHPASLASLIDWTLREILAGLATGQPLRRTRHHHVGTPQCAHCLCGRNPLVSYFDAARQALRQGLILTQATFPHLAPFERDASLAELNAVLDRVAQREIEAFCSVCQHREKLLTEALFPVALVVD
jgi:hypothetical protein